MRELLFTDDSALVAHSPEQMQKVVDACSTASKKFGLQIHIQKTEVLFQPSATNHRGMLMDGLRAIMGITWKGKVTNKEILERANLPSMEDLLTRKTLRWTGHVIRMTSERLPKQLIYSFNLLMAKESVTDLDSGITTH